MAHLDNDIHKFQRLNFKTYLQVIHNSIGSNMFRNFYVKSVSKVEFDALGDGDNSCAFYVSSILVIFKQLNRIHGTIESTIKDLHESGWIEVNRSKPGDILIWESQQFSDGVKEHMGFSIGNGKAVSTSAKQKTPVEHDQHFGNTKRNIIHIFRASNWD